LIKGSQEFPHNFLEELWSVQMVANDTENTIASQSLEGVKRKKQCEMDEIGLETWMIGL